MPEALLKRTDLRHLAPQVVQPAPPELPLRLENDEVNAARADVVEIPLAGNTVEDLIAALNKLGAPKTKLSSIIAVRRTISANSLSFVRRSSIGL